jgi:hypothetical protein
VRFAAVIGSAVSSMSTAELHERISAPHALHSPEGAISRHVTQFRQRTCFGSSPSKLSGMGNPQDRGDRS